MAREDIRKNTLPSSPTIKVDALEMILGEAAGVEK